MKTFIQVNIFGRSLDEFRDEGIYLKQVLQKLGCSKVWIAEGTVVDSSEYNVDDGNSEDVVVTSSEVQSEKSTILQSSERQESMMEITETETFPIFSTTIANLGVEDIPRSSTPIPTSSIDPKREFTLNLPKLLSKIGENDENREIRNLRELVDEELGTPREPIKKSVSMTENCGKLGASWNREVSSPPVLRTKESPENQPTPQIRENEESENLEIPEKRQKISLEVKPALADLQNYSPPSEYSNPEYVNNEDLFYSMASDQVEIEEEVEYEEEEEEEEEGDGGNSEGIQNIDDDEIQEEEDVREDGDDVGEEGGDDENGEKSESDDVNPSDDVDETLQMNFDDEDVHHTPPLLPNTLKTKSILKSRNSRNSKISVNSTKSVSFKMPKVTERQKQINESHRIRCGFQDCKKEIVWKIRYGKLRLVDHILTHRDEKCLGCRKCDYTCQTSRQMKYHYTKMHGDVKMEGFGILSYPLNDPSIKRLWSECFGAYSHIVGAMNTGNRGIRRNLKKLGENELSLDNSKEGSQFFYFRRIR